MAGTSKWNKISTVNSATSRRAGTAGLTDRLTAVEVIGATTTKAGVMIDCVLDEGTYEKGGRVHLAHATDNDAKTCKRFADGEVAANAAVTTDGHAGYSEKSLGERDGIARDTRNRVNPHFGTALKVGGEAERRR